MAKKNNIPVQEEISEKIVEKKLENAVHEFMMPYAEYIILDRALPRVEDGLKPVQRRILYTMHELNLKPEGQFKKSARVVGDCLGKYHPHGDSSVYQAMVNLAQDFSMRNPLVNGQGNFGSIDGDGAAAMRYTEVKLEQLAVEMLKDLEKNTVKWEKNFDDSLDEPSVLPAAFPNLLVNGAMGIAIGLATKIPPHNLTEVIDGTVALIDNPKMSLQDLLKIIKGPDFPTGGYICEGDSFEEIYSTGRGKIIMRAKVDIEVDNGKPNIVISEIPYAVNKSSLQVKIKELRDDLAQKDKNNILSGIQGIVDESDRNGIRVVIKLKKGEDATKVLEYLYQKTDLQCNFNVNMVAIAEGRPQQLGLIPLLNYYIGHRREIIYNRSKFDLENAQKREHILQGYVIILHDIDGVVALIKASSSRSDARDKLRAKYQLSDKQADAILDLKLVNLTKLEINKIEKELAELEVLIKKLTKIVSEKSEQYKVVKEELLLIRNKYVTKRLTKVVKSLDELDRYDAVLKDKKTNKRLYLLRDIDGAVKFISPVTYGKIFDKEPQLASEVVSEQILIENGLQPYAISSDGNCFRLDLGNAHESRLSDKGIMPADLSAESGKDVSFVKILTFTEDDMNKELCFYTKQGMVKKSLVSECVVSKDCYQVISLKEGDELVNVEIVNPYTVSFMVSSDGMALSVLPSEFSLTGRKTSGVCGMSLNDGAYLVYAGQAPCDMQNTIQGEIALIADNGYAKRIKAPVIEASKRARKGSKVMELGEKGKIIFVGLMSNLDMDKQIALLGKNDEIVMTSTQELLLDRLVVGKGKPLAVALGCKKSTTHLS